MYQATNALLNHIVDICLSRIVFLPTSAYEMLKSGSRCTNSRLYLKLIAAGKVYNVTPPSVALDTKLETVKLIATPKPIIQTVCDVFGPHGSC